MSQKRFNTSSRGGFGLSIGGQPKSQPAFRSQQKQWRNKPVCLDYLKGICHEKRWKCNYAHPPIQTSNSKKARSDVQCCEVWVLTGSCKFGENCRDYHPPLSEHAPCAPAKVSRQKSWSEESSGSEQDFAPSCCSLESMPRTPTTPLNVQELSLDQVVKKVNGILNKLTPEKFDSLLQQLFAIVIADNSEAYLERVVPLIFAKAIAEPKISALYATLTRHLYGLVGPDERPTVLKQLLQLCDRLLYEISDLVGSISEDQATKLQCKRSGNVRFLAELYSEGVIPLDEVISRLNYLLECAHGDGAEAQFSTQLICELLTLVGAALPTAAVSPILSALSQVAARHPQRVQFLVWNLMDLSGQEWQAPPAPDSPVSAQCCRFSISSSISTISNVSTPEHSPFLQFSDTATFSFCYDPYSANLYRTPYPNPKSEIGKSTRESRKEFF